MVSETHKVSYTTLIAAANGLVGEVTMAPAVKITLHTHTSFKRLIEKSNNAIVGLYSRVESICSKTAKVANN